MALPALPATGANWSSWAQGVHDAAAAVTDGRLTDASLRAALVAALQPESFGAKGDGTTDDTAALVAAITQASTSKRGLILTGVYRFSSVALTLDDVAITWLPGASLLCTLNKTVNTVPFRITGSRVRLFNPTMRYVTPLDVDTDGPSRPADADSFRLGGASPDSLADDIEVVGGSTVHSRNTAVRVRFATRVRVFDHVVDEAMGNGIMLDTCQDSVVARCRTRRTGDDGIVALAPDVDYLAGKSRNIQVVDNQISKSYANGVNFTGVHGGVIGGNLIEDTWAPAIRVWKDTTFSMGTCENVTIAPNTIKRAGRYFGAGQFHTAVMAVPVGVYCVGGVVNVTLHAQNFSDGQGSDAELIGGGVNDLRPSVPAIRQAANGYIGAPGVTAQTVTATQSLLTFHAISLAAKATTRNISVNITTAVAASTIRVGVYADSGGVPGALIAEADAVIDASSTGMKVATIVQTLRAGTYWLAAVAQGGAPGVRALSGKAIGLPASQDPGTSLNGWSQTAVTGALPTTASINGAVTSATAMTLGI